MIERVRGTRDILDTSLFTFSVEKIIKHVSLYHYEQIITPILEPVELFKRSLGTHTDVVSKEMFVVTSSSAQGDESICLRPEATASTVRAFVQEGVQTTPWKVFSWGPMFRYERPQKGRYRQFYQFNLECIGAASIAQDAQIISMLDRLFSEVFTLQNYALHVNFLGIPQERILFKEALAAFLESNAGICETCTKRKETNILRIFDCKSEACQTIYATAPRLVDFFGAESQEQWQQLQNYLEELSVSFVFNPRLVRGLDYYNKTVFEFVSPDLGAQSAFCGGGRYDSLVSQIGGNADQPSIGAAIGLDRLQLLLELIQPQLALPEKPRLHIIIPLETEQQGIALHLADALVRAGLTTEILFENSVQKMMRKANKLGAAYCIFIGSQEQEAGTAKVKDMQTGADTVLKQVDVAQFLKSNK